MKFLTLFAIGLSILFFGCTENNNLVQPDLEECYTSSPLFKVKDQQVRDTYDEFLKVKYSKTYTIDGEAGGKIKLEYMWNDGPSAGTKVECELQFEKNSFDGMFTFDLVINAEERFIDIYPSPFALKIPASLTLKFKGIDVSSYDPSTTTFIYISPTGVEIPTIYKSILINKEEGSLYVKSALLPHFSRFGFVR